jgi:hypothetical protein
VAGTAQDECTPLLAATSGVLDTAVGQEPVSGVCHAAEGAAAAHTPEPALVGADPASQVVVGGARNICPFRPVGCG